MISKIKKLRSFFSACRFKAMWAVLSIFFLGTLITPFGSPENPREDNRSMSSTNTVKDSSPNNKVMEEDRPEKKVTIEAPLETATFALG
jgi:hypothetical protein